VCVCVCVCCCNGLGIIVEFMLACLVCLAAQPVVRGVPIAGSVPCHQPPLASQSRRRVAKIPKPNGRQSKNYCSLLLSHKQNVFALVKALEIEETEGFGLALRGSTMEWLQAPEGGHDDKRNSFVDVHPESKKLLSQIGLWQIVTGEEGGGGGGGRFTSRNRGWPNEADDDTPSLTSEDERRYWDEVKVSGFAHAPRSPQRPAPTTKMQWWKEHALTLFAYCWPKPWSPPFTSCFIPCQPASNPSAKPHRPFDASLSAMPIAAPLTSAHMSLRFSTPPSPDSPSLSSPLPLPFPFSAPRRVFA
jgi:hypothetical protein